MALQRWTDYIKCHRSLCGGVAAACTGRCKPCTWSSTGRSWHSCCSTSTSSCSVGTRNFRRTAWFPGMASALDHPCCKFTM